MIDTDRVRSEFLLKAAVVLFDYVDDIIVDLDEAEKYVRKVLHDPKILL